MGRTTELLLIAPMLGVWAVHAADIVIAPDNTATLIEALTPIALATISALSSMVAVVFSYRANTEAKLAKEKSEETHHSVNSRMDDFLKKQEIAVQALLEATRIASRAEGVREGTAANTAEAAIRAMGLLEGKDHPKDGGR